MHSEQFRVMSLNLWPKTREFFQSHLAAVWALPFIAQNIQIDSRLT